MKEICKIQGMHAFDRYFFWENIFKTSTKILSDGLTVEAGMGIVREVLAKSRIIF